MDNFNFRAPNLVCVCIDRIERREFSGRLLTRYSREPTPFNGAGEMLTKMDLFFNQISFPQASTITRSFSKTPEATVALGKKEEVQVMSAEELLDLKGVDATFVVHIKYRQHATWQGSVVWAEKNITRNFRSALELLKLIDGTLDKMDDADDNGAIKEE